MLEDIKTVSLFKGHHLGDNSPTSSKVKSAASPNPDQIRVTPSYTHTASSSDSAEEAVWFLMRAAYGQEGKAKDYLESKGIETFLPLTEKSYICRGKVRHKQVSLIPNFLFVKSNEKEMKKYVGKGELTFFHHYYVPHKDEQGKNIGKKGIKPLVIPLRQMQSFMKWNAVQDDNKLFIADDNMPFAKNDYVRVIEGKFAGLEGFVCRIKGHSRVGVAIDGVGTIFTAYVPKGMLKLIEK